MKSLNIGIVAHVDAGKTSLTERLLYEAGVIDQIGSVDDGNTQTDSLALEQKRGITIKSAVVSFVVGDTTINLIDTPGHPDFIAEVERVLGVLDVAVLVISAVEGVQAQTRILMKTLKRLRIPTIIFVNKIDRVGARYESLLQDIAEKLTLSLTVMGGVNYIGTPGAQFILTNESSTLAVNHSTDSLYPVYFGSAMTGEAVNLLIPHAIKLLPAKIDKINDLVSGVIFKIERGSRGEKIAYARLFSGTICIRDSLHFAEDNEAKVTAIDAFEDGTTARVSRLEAGQIGKIWGLDEARIGDMIGMRQTLQVSRHFAPPTLETVVDPVTSAEKGKLRVALDQLAEQDPLINLRQDDTRQELSVSLYGEVQKEVIHDTLFSDFGIAVTFRDTTTICTERPIGVGEAVETKSRVSKSFMEWDGISNPFLATVGLKIEPATQDTGIVFRLASEVLGTMPLAFFKAVEESVHETLRQGIYGWKVTDCIITMTHSGYWPRQSSAHGGFDKNISSTARDFRLVTPLVLMKALERAGSVVCEPIHHFQLEIPKEVLAVISSLLAKLGAAPETTTAKNSSFVIEGTIPAARIQRLQQQLPGLTSGEGVLEYVFDSYRPVYSNAPTRSRSGANPLHRREYLLQMTKRV